MTDRWRIRHCIPAGGAVDLWTGSNPQRVQEAADHVRQMLLAEGLSVPVLTITPNTSTAELSAGRAIAQTGAVPFILAIAPGCHNVSLVTAHADIVLSVANNGYVRLCKGNDTSRIVEQHSRALIVEPRPEPVA